MLNNDSNCWAFNPEGRIEETMLIFSHTLAGADVFLVFCCFFIPGIHFSKHLVATINRSKQQYIRLNNKQQQSVLVNRWEKSLVIAFMILFPIYHIVISYGSQLGKSPFLSSPSDGGLLAWVMINFMSLALLCMSMYSRSRFRYYLSGMWFLQLASAAFQFVDRLSNDGDFWDLFCPVLLMVVCIFLCFSVPPAMQMDEPMLTYLAKRGGKEDSGSFEFFDYGKPKA